MMSGSGQKKSLTQPPTNLKEAIDWVLRVSEKDSGKNDNDAIKGLAQEVINLLDKDAGEVAGGVWGVMGGVFDGLVKKLNDDSRSDQKPGQGTFKVLKAYLQTFKGNLESVRDYGSSLGEQDLSKLKGWLTGDSSGPIAKLADGLEKFIGYEGGQVKNGGIGKNGNYTSAYKSDPVDWKGLGDSDRRKCALIFLGISPILFYGLTYLYWWCEGTGGWSKLDVSGGSTTLSKYMTAIGFNDKYLNDSQSPGQKVAEIMKNAFQQELDSAMQSAKSEAKQRATAAGSTSSSSSNHDPSYPMFLGAIEKNDSSESYRPEHRPLLSSHRIVTPFFTPNDTYTVETTSPVTPSFAGYSGLTALAGGAYGLNIGGLNTFVSALLA
ncbi:variant erythrocyte surface antigen-1 family protein [Babesia caballi]|uniref:Variant erythrocyte surface antigen-1 family protein n=1 Tax=Babesia caballi TaxID=5871 RepID=A0AAV4LZ21_BABCB|nr:variant erythrocyte surface antigen-1 family protein [Babesia caballi]